MLAMVNRVLIPEHHINAETAYLEYGTIDEKRAEATRRLAVKELLRQRARDLGIATQDRLDAAIEDLLAQEVEVPEATAEECQRYFQANRERFCTPVHVRMAHILLAAAPDDPEERSQARDLADELLAQLQADPQAFVTLARQYSRCPSAEQGGELGWIGRGQTVPELENVVLRMKPGLDEHPVETRYGYHIVRVDERSGGYPLEYDEVKHMITDYLQERSWRRAVSQYIDMLAGDADIRGVDLQASETPLVQ